MDVSHLKRMENINSGCGLTLEVAGGGKGLIEMLYNCVEKNNIQIFGIALPI